MDTRTSDGPSDGGRGTAAATSAAARRSWRARRAVDGIFGTSFREVGPIRRRRRGPGGLRRGRDWSPRKVAGADARSWHAAAHGSSVAEARYEFEAALLEEDLAEYPDDRRVLYYLGVDYVALARFRKGRAARAAYERALAFLGRRVELDRRRRRRAPSFAFDGSVDGEMTYVALLHVALCLEGLGDDPGAEEALEIAKRFDGARAEAPLRLVALLTREDRTADAALEAGEAAALPEPLRAFYHHPAMYACDAPFRVDLSALSRVAAPPRTRLRGNVRVVAPRGAAATRRTEELPCRGAAAADAPHSRRRRSSPGAWA